MEKQKLLGASLLVILVGLLLFLIFGRDEKESFRKCICGDSSQGDRAERCQDTIKVEKAYDSGEATEFTNFKSKGWSTISPGDYDFPSCNCGDPSEQKKGWTTWDFTDFGK